MKSQEIARRTSWIEISVAEVDLMDGGSQLFQKSFRLCQGSPRLKSRLYKLKLSVAIRQRTATKILNFNSVMKTPVVCSFFAFSLPPTHAIATEI